MTTVKGAGAVVVRGECPVSFETPTPIRLT
jgi:hypothetical protein